MKSSLFFVTALVVALFVFSGVVPASASTLDWTITGTGISGAGTLTLGTEYTPGVFGVTDVTGSFTDTANGIAGTISYPFVANGGTQTSPDGLYFFDNLLYQQVGQTLFDSGGGLLFLVNGGASFANGAEVNIAGNGNGGYQVWRTTANAQYLPGSGAGDVIQFEATTGGSGDGGASGAPEPASMFLLGSGMIVLGSVRYRKRAR